MVFKNRKKMRSAKSFWLQ